jgi:hypothetical protein
MDVFSLLRRIGVDLAEATGVMTVLYAGSAGCAGVCFCVS